MEKELKFKVGDKVRIIETWYQGFPMGSIAQIIQTDNTVVPYYCANDKYKLWFHESSIENLQPQVRLIADYCKGWLDTQKYFSSLHYETLNNLCKYNNIEKFINNLDSFQCLSLMWYITQNIKKTWNKNVLQLIIENIINK